MRKLLVWSTLLLALLAVVDWLNPVREGLNGTYYANANWSNPPATSAVDRRPSNDALSSAFHGAPPAAFSATWAGSMLAMNDGPYALATISDDGSAVYVDGQLVVDNGGLRDWPRGATGLVQLTRGVHAIYIQYAQQGGPFHVELLWARAGQPLELIPSWALTPRRVSFPLFAISASVKRALALAEWLWVTALAAGLLTIAWARARNVQSWLQREQAWSAFKWVLAGSLILNAAGLWWGVPGGIWVPDEVTPTLVLGAAAQWFGNGWFDRYPPLHYYVLAAASSPLILLERLGRIDLAAPGPYMLMVVIGRLVSLAAGAGTLIAIYAAGAQSLGRRAGLFAAAMFALIAPFVYYAKAANVDVPYLFWFAISLVFYLRALRRLALADFVAFAAFGMLAICTKDQAYGLYLLMPFVLAERIWRDNRQSGRRHSLIGALTDRRMIAAAVASVVVFAGVHNVPLNIRGFADHVRLITGPASESYRDFEPTLQGRIALFRLTLHIVGMAWGWPMFVVSMAGIVLALSQRTTRQAAIWLAVPMISYYVGFIDVVLYNYDRFMLPVCLVLSLFGGLAFDRWLPKQGWRRNWRTVPTVAVFACTLMYAVTVDTMMLRDSRYTVEQWLTAHIRRDDSVGYVFPMQYYPRLDRFNHAELVSPASLAQVQPAFFVLNADYARSEPKDSEIGRMITGLHSGRLGYSLAFRYRETVPWPWLPGAPRDLVGDRTERPIVSVLRHINPEFEVYTRNQPPAAAVSQP
jgi:hypothetical protein